MKWILGILVLYMLSACYSRKEIQVEMVNAELVKIDTVYRFQQEQQQLTWRDDLDIEYVTYFNMDKNFLVGTKMLVLRRR